jgi:hypothetical protein
VGAAIGSDPLALEPDVPVMAENTEITCGSQQAAPVRPYLLGYR